MSWNYFNPRGGFQLSMADLRPLDKREISFRGLPSRKLSIEGPILCGFSELFEEHFGNSNTPEPYVTVVPSFVGNSLLPFSCPKCKRPAQELACPLTREKYHDKRVGRDSYWCPACGWRFNIDLNGTKLPCSLKAGAEVGPSLVKEGERTRWQDRRGILGWLFGNGKVDYAALTT